MTIKDVLLSMIILSNMWMGDALSSNEYVRGCYYTNWAQYRVGRYQFKPGNIDYSLCNVIYFAFGIIDSDYLLQFYEWNDEAMLSEILAMKKAKPELKVVMSVGGWNFNICEEDPQKEYTCDRFSKLAENPNYRYTFTSSTIAFLRTYGFDGLDIDWEFPAHPQRNGYGATPRDDASNLVSLVKDLRVAMQRDAFASGQERLSLSIAVGVGPVNSRGYAIRSLCDAEYGVDHVNLMTYDMHGTWDGVTGHNAPLFETTSDVETFGYEISDSRSVDDWIEGGCAAKKLILGMATYGRGFSLLDSSNHDFLAPISGASPPGPGTAMDGFYSYDEILTLLEAGVVTEAWDEERGVPYAYNDQIWIGYDNEKSIRLKTAYAKYKKLGGGMIWTLDFDNFQDGKYPLLRAMNNEFDSLANVLFGEPPVCLTSTLQSEAPLDTAQIVPEFPEGVWDGVDCSQATMAALPSRCADALDESSTNAEKLACAIVNQTLGIPIGIYKNDVMPDTELAEISDSMLSKIVDSCGVAKLVENSCFSYTVNDWPAYSKVTKIMNEKSTVTTNAVEQTTMRQWQVKFSTGYEQVNLNQGVSFQRSFVARNVKATKTQKDYKLTRIRAEWNAEYGMLSMNGCLNGGGLANTGVINEAYLNDWQSLQGLTSDTEIKKSQSFARIAQQGTIFPSTYSFAIRLSTNIESMYSAMIQAGDETMEWSYNNALLLTQGAEYVMTDWDPQLLTTLRNSEGVKTINARIDGNVTRVGDCNFDAVSADPESWSKYLQKCASRAAASFERMSRAAYIPVNGFVTVDQVVAASGVEVNPLVTKLLAEDFTYCKCNIEKTAFSCYRLQTEDPLYTRNMVNCDRSFWVPHTTPPEYNLEEPLSFPSFWSMASYGGESTARFSISGFNLQVPSGSPFEPITMPDAILLSYDPSTGILSVLESLINQRKSLAVPPGDCFGGAPYGLYLDIDGSFRSYSLLTKYECT